ncbi:MAG: toxin-antitoxin system TumE family protein [Anaerolineae bacterium]
MDMRCIIGRERLYWYDDFPHPNDPILASTFPHHKHIPHARR